MLNYMSHISRGSGGSGISRNFMREVLCNLQIIKKNEVPENVDCENGVLSLIIVRIPVVRRYKTK